MTGRDGGQGTMTMYSLSSPRVLDEEKDAGHTSFPQRRQQGSV